MHHAFTSIVKWRGAWYLAHRSAENHGIMPPGIVQILKSTDGETWETNTTLIWGHQNRRRTPFLSPYVLDGDVRDPRLCASTEALYVICGTYLPKHPNATLADRPAENIIQSMVAYTEDGMEWTTLEPISRPNYWIWSAMPLQQSWIAAAYHVGAYTEASSLHLLSGPSLFDLVPAANIYDGATCLKDGAEYLYPHASPCEPVLYTPTAHTIACCARSEAGMDIGVSQYPWQDWRWHNTKVMIHPSAVFRVGDTWLLAGRELSALKTTRGTAYATYTSLWELNAQTVTWRLRLPSSGDTGYAGICQGRAPNELFVSYYSQHGTGKRFGKTLQGAGLFLATVTIS